jgi:TPR repeat protein
MPFNLSKVFSSRQPEPAPRPVPNTFPPSTPQISYVPQRLEIEGMPHLNVLPANVLFGSDAAYQGGRAFASALYNYDLKTLEITPEKISMVYRNEMGGDSWLRIDYDRAKPSYYGEKFLNGNSLFASIGYEFEKFFSIFTRPGLRAGEPCRFESYPTPGAPSIASLRDEADRGDTQAQTLLGRKYERGDGVPQDYSLAQLWYLKAAEGGDTVAQFLLGDMYRSGRGVTKDYAQAITWIRKAADAGYDVAQKEMAGMYSSGLGVPKDDASAFDWFRKAAEQGDPDAQCVLGKLYESGTGVRQDYTQAFVWYRKGAEQNYVPAQASLGLMHYYEQQFGEAFFWLDIAASGRKLKGFEWIPKLRYDAGSRLSSVDCAQEMQRARQWLNEHPTGTDS